MITFMTVLNITLLSGMIIALLHCFLHKTRIILFNNLNLVAALMVVILLRLLLPFELPTQRNIYITHIFPKFYVALYQPRFTFIGREWDIMSLLIALTIAGSIYFFIKLISAYFNTQKKVKKLKAYDNPVINEVVASINKTYRKPVQFQIKISTQADTPFIFGLFKPCIVLPELDLSPKYWEYILTHEISHYYRKDLWIRFLCELLHIIYWWNPFIIILRKQIIEIQEFRSDASVIKQLGCIEKLDYTECLIHIAKIQNIKPKENLANICITSFSSGSDTDIGRRINWITNKDKFTKKHCTKTGILVVALLFLLSLLPDFFILESKPQNIPSTILEQYTIINSENAYYVYNDKGTYDLYVNGKYFSTVTKIFNNTLTIYYK